MTDDILYDQEMAGRDAALDELRILASTQEAELATLSAQLEKLKADAQVFGIGSGLYAWFFGVQSNLADIPFEYIDPKGDIRLKAALLKSIQEAVTTP